MKKLCIVIASLLCLAACGKTAQAKANITAAAKPYTAVIEAYHAYYTALQQIEQKGDPDGSKFEQNMAAFEEKLADINIYGADLYGCIVEPTGETYSVHDINGDGIPELLIGDINAIFTLQGGKPVLIDVFWSRSSCAISADGTVYHHGSGGAAYSINTIMKLEPGAAQFTVIESGTLNGYDADGQPICHRTANGKKMPVTFDAYQAWVADFPQSGNSLAALGAVSHPFTR